jgi:hypothetical protein
MPLKPLIPQSSFLYLPRAPEAATYPVPPKPLSAEYFDGWYASQAATQVVAGIMNRHMGFPPGTRAGMVHAGAIPEPAEALRLRPGSRLLVKRSEGSSSPVAGRR